MAADVPPTLEVQSHNECKLFATALQMLLFLASAELLQRILAICATFLFGMRSRPGAERADYAKGKMVLPLWQFTSDVIGIITRMRMGKCLGLTLAPDVFLPRL